MSMTVAVPYLVSSGFPNLGTSDIRAGPFSVVGVCPVRRRVSNSVLPWMPVALPRLPSRDNQNYHQTLSMSREGRSGPS